MKQGTVEITATAERWCPVEDCDFTVTISKGEIRHRSRFWGLVDAWKDFGAQLIEFPKRTSDRIRLELGTDVPGSFLALEAYCYDKQGHTALAVTVNENDEEPRHCLLEFSILAEVASLNSLGNMLFNWQVEDASKVLWEAQTS